MRRQLLRVSLAVVFGGVPSMLFAQGKFEGVVTARIATGNLTYLVKGDRLRIEMGADGRGSYMLRDVTKNSMDMVMPGQRMYMDLKAMAGVTQSAAAKAPDIKATGRKETIAGYECEHMLVTAEDGQYDVCAAKGLGGFLMPSGPMGSRGGASSGSSLDRLGRDVFPLRVQKVGASVDLEVTKIEKKALDDAMFKVPDGFQKFQMPGRP